MGVLALALGLGYGAAQAQVPGETIRVTVDQLPAPYATGSASNSPSPVERSPTTMPAVPAGFRVGIFADRFQGPRSMIEAPDGAILVAETQSDRITILRDPSHTGVASERSVFLKGLDRPFGMAFHDGDLYVADVDAVWRIPYRAGMTAVEGKPVAVTPKGALGEGSGHSTRSLAFSRDGRHFFVGIGSRSNIAEENAPRAAIQQFNSDGSGQRSFATGLRNPVGIALAPGTDDLYAVVNERDGLGDGLVPDYFTRVTDGGFYGWPYSYLGAHPQPGLGDKRPDLVVKAIVPDVLFRSHSAPITMVFYTGDAFPAAYRGSAFVALHGSWNAAVPSGYMVAMVPFADGRPTGAYQVFAAGFQVGGPGKSKAWGRPAGLLAAPDGSLLIADDLSDTIWRVTYDRKTAQ